MIGMKLWHAGLIVAGAALAGGLAMRLAEVPPDPKQVAAGPVAQEPAQEAAAPPAEAPAVRWKAAPPPEAVASAPPPVYTEPPPPPPTAKRKPFPPAVAPVAKMPMPKPVPYQEPPVPSRHVTLEPGMSITVRVSEGVLAEPVVVNGLEIAERGARVSVRAENGNRARLMSFQSADGQRVEVSTEAEPASGNVIRFRLAARLTITERKL
jgi:outer membrane biosynthesis protein TonB